MRRLLQTVLVFVPIIALMAGCVAEVKTDPVPSRIDVDVTPPRKAVDVDVNVTPKP